MNHQDLAIGQSLKATVRWIDRVPEPAAVKEYQAEVIGWRNSQMIVRVKDYAVVRFWKRTGIEVGNKDHERRGFFLDVKGLEESLKPVPGLTVDLGAIDQEEAAQVATIEGDGAHEPVPALQ
jgi:hypothetical protein